MLVIEHGLNFARADGDAEVDQERPTLLLDGDRQTVADAEIELSRLWSRVCDMERQRVAST